MNKVNGYNDYLVKSYVHMAEGVISQDEYDMLRAGFRRQIEETEQSIISLQTELERLSDNCRTIALINQFKENGNITELDRRMVISLIHSIIVHDSKNLEIRFRYSSGLATPDEYTTAQASMERMVG